jgi:protein-tyrosine kinase
MSLIKEALKRARAAHDEERRQLQDSGGHLTSGEEIGRYPTAQVLAGPRHARINFDWEALRASGVFAPLEDDELIARQIRDIKRPLIAHAFGKRATPVENGNLIMVTSALAGEGKTFISFNLARSMAGERDHSVLLVDADVAKPHTTSLLGLENSFGLLDLLDTPGQRLDTAILETEVAGLSVLPAGKPRRHATELLASSHMENLTQSLVSSDRNRIVLFDSPPLLQTSESKALAEYVGQVVFVVCADKTPKGAVAEAIMSLGEGNKAVNVLLNKVASSAVVARYGYGATAQYGSDYRYGNTTSNDPGADLRNSVGSRGGRAR